MVFLLHQESATCPKDCDRVIDFSTTCFAAKQSLSVIDLQQAISGRDECGENYHHNGNIGRINTTNKKTTTTMGVIQIARCCDPKRQNSTFQDDDNEIEEDDSVELVAQDVALQSFRGCGGGDGGCASSSPSSCYKDLIQSYHFRDFDGLDDFMQPLKEKLIQRHAATLRLVHEKFQTILQDIVDNKGLYRSVLDEGPSSSSLSESRRRNEVAMFATPNVRLKRGTYATFLHSDAVYPAAHHHQHNSDNVDPEQHFSMKKKKKKTSTTGARAMLNVWMSLSDTPIANFPLCFAESSRHHTIFAENKLFYLEQQVPTEDDENDHESRNASVPLPMWYDPTLTWGSFLCFVAGQPESDDRVLLHGAVDLTSGRPCRTTTGGQSRNNINNNIDDISKNDQNILNQNHSTVATGDSTIPSEDELVVVVAPVVGRLTQEPQENHEIEHCISDEQHVTHKTNPMSYLARTATTASKTTKVAKKQQYHPRDGRTREEPRKSLEMRYVV